ncbi:MAG: hypothetical protein AB7K52_15815 [Phycisphaerales bacterium]
MKRTASPDGSPRRKRTFGGATVDRFSPPVVGADTRAVNVVLSFEEALKLHLSLGQLLGHLNGFDRSTKAGRRMGVNLHVNIQNRRVVVYDAKVAE